MRNFLYAFKVVLLCLFSVRHYASAEYAVALCLSVCLFVPSESSLETAKHIITQTSAAIETEGHTGSHID